MGRRALGAPWLPWTRSPLAPRLPWTRSPLAPLAAVLLTAAAGCAEIIGASFDDARLGAGDDAAAPAEDSPSPNPDVSPPVTDSGPGVDHNVPPVDAPAPDVSPGPCEAGYGYLPTQNLCVAYAGSYQFQDPNCRSTGITCRHPNPITDACSCPQGAATAGTMHLLLDCDNNALLLGTIDNCQAAGSAPTHDWAGAYQQKCNNSSCSSPTCNVPNAYTTTCTCPAGSQSLSFDEVLDVGVLGKMVFCYNQGVAPATFAGAYQTFGSSCGVPNPETGDCTCPAGANIHGVRVLHDVASPNPAPVWVCIPGI